MKRNPFRLPWKKNNVPHCLLDIIRGCNIKCAACYNTESNKIKNIQVIDNELNYMSKLRKLNSVSLIGGEPTLHPDLIKIVKMIHNRNFNIELCTNGVLVDDKMAKSLKEAGVNQITFHIEAEQKRPDLPTNYTKIDLLNLRKSKLELAAKNNLDPGLILTIHPDKLEEIDEIVNFFLIDPHALYLIITLYRDVQAIDFIEGNIFEGMKGKLNASFDSQKILNMDVIQNRMSQLSLYPFAYVGSNLDKTSPRWLSYLIATVHDNYTGEVDWLDITPSYLEPTFLKMYYLIMRHYPFYMRQNPKKLHNQIFFNALLGGRFKKNINFLKRIKGKESHLIAKRILFQNPAMVHEDGTVEHCRNCPDAVIKDQQVVPVCISDRVKIKGS